MNQGRGLIYILPAIIVLVLGAYYLGNKNAQQTLSSQQLTTSTINSQVTPTTTPTAVGTPTISKSPSVQLLPTAGWKMASNNTFSILYPADKFSANIKSNYVQLLFNSDNSVGPDLLIADDYSGESRRQWYLKHYSYGESEVGKNLFFIEKTLGSADVIEVNLPNEKNPRDILIAHNKTLIEFLTQGADLQTAETIASTISFK